MSETVTEGKSVGKQEGKRGSEIVLGFETIHCLFIYYGLFMY